MSENLLSLGAVMEKTQFGRSKIYDMVGRQQFPKPVKIGGSSRWRGADVDQWIASHFAEG